MRILFALFTALLVLTGCVQPAARRPANLPPNIVFILADDLGYGDLGCYGQTNFVTPRIDGLAKHGLRLTRHYAGSTVCQPSRCVLFTGQHTGHAQVRANGPGTLAAGTENLATVLKRAGYATGCFGKYGVCGLMPDDEPLRHGFDTFHGYVNTTQAHNFFPPFLIHDGRREPLPNIMPPGAREDGVGVAVQKNAFAPDVCERSLLTFIGAHRDQPFFAFYSPNLPHANNEAGKQEGNGFEAPTDFAPFATRDWPAPEKGFATSIAWLDRSVGRILDRLDALGLADNTLVIFTSDNGPHAEGGHDDTFFHSAGSLRGKKRDLYEGGIRVPCLIRWPDNVPAGQTSAAVSGFQDWLPTLAAVARTNAPPTDGIDLFGTGEGPRNLYWEFYEQGGSRAVLLDGRWKAIQNGWPTSPGTWQLYDLQTDAAESLDLAGQNPDLVRRAATFADQAHTPRP